MAIVISDSRNSKYGTSVHTVAVAAAGSGYTVSDVLTLTGGDGNATVTVATINGSGGVTSITRTTVGSGYSASTSATSGGTGTGCTITVTVQAGLGCTNGWYRVEASNVGHYSATGSQFSTTVPKLINVTFANAGNCQGLILGIYNPVWVSTPSSIGTGINVQLQENIGTCTITVASPGVVTRVAHGLSNDTKISFSTTGSLPTGLTAGLTYYTRNVTANTFEVSATSGGSSINTSGTQSGTHSLWVMRTEQSLTKTEITPSTYIMGNWLTPFKFATPYAVTTAATTWRFSVAQTTAATQAWQLKCSDSGGTSFFYITWCDNQLSFTNNDTMVVMDTIYIDKSFKTVGTLGTSDTVYGMSAIICANASDPTAANVSKLLLETTPQASYTWTIDGVVSISAHGGIRIGTSGNRVPYAKQFIISFVTRTVGTQTSVILGSHSAANNQGNSRASLFLYGEIPTYGRTTLNGSAAASQANITTTDSTGWGVGDLIGIGKITAKGITSSETNRSYAIQSISGTAITLTSNIQSARSSGASVINLTRYGIRIQTDTSSATTSNVWWNNIVLSGVATSDWSLSATTATSSAWGGYMDDSTYTSTWTFEDCSLFKVNTLVGTNLSIYVGCIPPDGITLNRCYFYSRTISGGLTCEYYPTEGTNYAFSSGTFTVTNCTLACMRYNQTAATAFMVTTSKNCKLYIVDNYWESTDKSFYEMEGLNVTYSGNYIYGANDTTGGVGSVIIGQLIKPTLIGDNTYENNLLAVSFGADSTIDALDSASTFTSNTTDIKLNAFAYIDYTMNSPVGNLSITTTQLPDTLIGSSFKVIGFNSNTADHRNYNKYGYLFATGTGLSDTTADTISGSYAVRFEPTSSSSTLDWEYRIPTGDLENKRLLLGIRLKINSATYYAGTHQLPRLTANYDNGTIAYVQAAETTSWQTMFLPLQPATDYGEIVCTISGRTDATTTNAYFYVAKRFIAYPTDTPINLENADLWANALPVDPPIAVPLTAFTVSNAVWEELKANHTTSASFGEHVGKKLLSTSKFIALK